ncbi:MAG: peptidoglycan DD-metalloendopeptidase family protein, partial [Prevotella sp.]|nr:peptidoglycan DD-metalloendopeptidase family protein [Prevotella sp.]
LQDLLVINTEIDQRKKSIDDIQKDITQINGNIDILNTQLATLQAQLDDRKAKYIKSMQYMSRNRSVQENLMFVFSAKNLGQMYRRMRFVREYAAYQKAQGELVKTKQNQVNEKYRQLESAKGEKNNLLSKDKKEHAALQNKQGEQEKMVAGLQKQQKTIQAIIDEQRKKDAALNAQIDRLIAIEVEKARKRAEEEARKKAEAAAAAKRQAEELARKKAAAEAAAKEAARRIAEAKAREEKMREEARLAAEATERAKKAQVAAEQRKAEERQARADQAAREAEAARKAAERKAEADRSRSEKEIAEAKKDVEEAKKFSTVDRMLSGGFEANKGRLPMPVTGSYRVVSHFGQYNVEGLKGVRLDNKGINIMGSPGCQARSIYDGEVSAVFGYSGTMVVMVRHGSYISVYCNLQSVSVTKGQKVSTRQTLGTVGQENILQFQLRKETAKLNPEVWLGR